MTVNQDASRGDYQSLMGLKRMDVISILDVTDNWSIQCSMSQCNKCCTIIITLPLNWDQNCSIPYRDELGIWATSGAKGAVKKKSCNS